MLFQKYFYLPLPACLQEGLRFSGVVIDTDTTMQRRHDCSRSQLAGGASCRKSCCKSFWYHSPWICVQVLPVRWYILFLIQTVFSYLELCWFLAQITHLKKNLPRLSWTCISVKQIFQSFQWKIFINLNSKFALNEVSNKNPLAFGETCISHFVVVLNLLCKLIFK